MSILDITKCAGDDCPVKEQCLRFMVPSHLYYQSWGAFAFDPDRQECDDFI